MGSKVQVETVLQTRSQEAACQVDIKVVLSGVLALVELNVKFGRGLATFLKC